MVKLYSFKFHTNPTQAISNSKYSTNSHWWGWISLGADESSSPYWIISPPDPEKADGKRRKRTRNQHVDRCYFDFWIIKYSVSCREHHGCLVFTTIGTRYSFNNLCKVHDVLKNMIAFFSLWVPFPFFSLMGGRIVNKPLLVLIAIQTSNHLVIRSRGLLSWL